MPETPSQPGQDFGLAVVGSCHGDVSPFRREWKPAPVRRDQGGDAEPGSRPQHGNRCIPDRRAAADLQTVVLVQIRDGRRHGNKIIDH